MIFMLNGQPIDHIIRFDICDQYVDVHIESMDDLDKYGCKYDVMIGSPDEFVVVRFYGLLRHSPGEPVHSVKELIHGMNFNKDIYVNGFKVDSPIRFDTRIGEVEAYFKTMPDFSKINDFTIVAAGRQEDIMITLRGKITFRDRDNDTFDF